MLGANVNFERTKILCVRETREAGREGQAGESTFRSVLPSDVVGTRPVQLRRLGSHTSLSLVLLWPFANTRCTESFIIPYALRHLNRSFSATLRREGCRDGRQHQDLVLILFSYLSNVDRLRHTHDSQLPQHCLAAETSRWAPESMSTVRDTLLASSLARRAWSAEAHNI